MADPLTGQSLLGVWQCQPGIMEEEGVVISGVREEEQTLLDCILLWAMFFLYFNLHFHCYLKSNTVKLVLHRISKLNVHLASSFERCIFAKLDNINMTLGYIAAKLIK